MIAIDACGANDYFLCGSLHPNIVPQKVGAGGTAPDTA